MNDNLKEHLLSIRKAALEAADPFAAVQRAIRLHEPTSSHATYQVEINQQRWQINPENRLLLVAAGKAAIRMAEAAAQVLKPVLTEGIVVTKYGHTQSNILP